jgi:hypothetical protein
MQFQILDFRYTSPSIVCDCGAEFFETDEAIDHVKDEHCGSEGDWLFPAMKFLSPNPIFIVGGGHAAE